MSQKFEYFGKYILLEKLATGGMAEVWLARTQGAGGIGKFVAIKKILPQYSDNPEFIQMFKDEAAIAMNLSHGNIVSIYEFGQEDNQLFLVMDYVEGRNLRQILNKMKQNGAKFNMDQIIYMMKEVASGLDHAHRSLNSATGKPLNITHRDMSPQNIMITFEGEVKIVDFGIAKAESQMDNTRTGTLKGKFGYMSPEQADGNSTDLRTDVFSLGIVLWELLANDRLFIANNEINTLKKIRECIVPPLTKINPNIHPELERIVMKALTRDRNLRYQTSAAFHRDLSRFLNRQFPDFSPQDFSIYIKTMYTDEILELRKRLVDYSKIPFQTTVAKKDFDHESTLLTSFPQASTGSAAKGASISTIKTVQTKITSSSVKDSKLVATESSLAPTDSFSDIKEKSGSIELAADTGSHAAPAENSTQSEPTESSGSSEYAQSSVSISKVETADPMNSEIIIQAKTPRILNEDSVKKNLNKKIIINPKMPSLDSAFHGGDSLSLEVTKNRTERSDRKVLRRVQETSSNATIINLFVGVAFFVGTYILAANYFPDQIHQAEMLLRNVLDQSSTKKAKSSTQSAPAPTTSDAIPSGATETKKVEIVSAPIEKITPPPKDFQDQVPLTISSDPSGAEIYINGLHTGKITPARVSVPADGAFNLTLKLERYIDYTKPDLTAASAGKSFSATLQRLNVAYLDIDVSPPTNSVRISINDKVLKDDVFPISKYAVPALVDITVTAVNLTTGETIKKNVKPKPDQKLPIVFQFGKHRAPSGDR